MLTLVVSSGVRLDVDSFYKQAVAMLACKDAKELIAASDALLLTYPKCKKWLEWWLRPANAKMLFPVSWFTYMVFSWCL